MVLSYMIFNFTQFNQNNFNDQQDNINQSVQKTTEPTKDNAM